MLGAGELDTEDLTKRMDDLEKRPVGFPQRHGKAHMDTGQDRIPGLITGVSLEIVLHVYEADATWTKPANLAYIRVRTLGPGGGGGGADNAGAVGGGGGGGGYAEAIISGSSLNSTEAVVIGLGGTAGADTGGVGGDGDQTVFGNWLGADGGLGGAGSASAIGLDNVGYTLGGSGGAGFALDADPVILGTGGTGSPGFAVGTASAQGWISGGGGVAHMGGGGVPRGSVGAQGNPGKQYGGGGGGAAANSTTNRAGSVGADGAVFVEEFIFTYTQTEAAPGA